MTSTDTFIRVENPPRPVLIAGRDVPPLLLVGLLAALALIGNLWAHLTFQLPMALVLAGPLACFALSLGYRTVRHDAKIAETSLYLGLWLFYPAFGVALTYLATRADFPYADPTFMAWDRVLGFDWIGWARFVLGHPLLKFMQDAAYSSCFWQPLAAVPIFAWAGPRGRNGEFLTSVMLGLLATIFLYMLLPTIGPADMNHIAAEQGRVIRALRGGFLGPYVYVGIISFPSFHTVMAILFTLAFRGHRWLFAGIAALNLVMLTAVPFQGDHYLVDMIAGAGIAAGAFFAARQVYREV